MTLSTSARGVGLVSRGALALALLFVASRGAIAQTATFTNPANGATNVDVAQPMQWTAVSGAQAYQLWIGSTAGSSNLLDSFQTQQTSWAAPLLPAGQTVYARIWTEVNNTWSYSQISFTVAPIARITTPVAGATAFDAATAIQWTSVQGAQAYQLWIGSSVGSSNLLDSAQTQATRWTAPSLPPGQLVYARLWTESGNV